MGMTTSTLGSVRSSAQIMAIGGIAVAGLIVFAANYHVSKGDNGGVGPALVTAAGCLLVTGLLYVLVLPRTRRPGRTVVVLGALAVLSLVVFWSGITPVLAGGALAVTSRPADVGRRAVVAQWSGGVAAIVAVVATLASSQLL
jgi:hypothetical protein